MSARRVLVLNGPNLGRLGVREPEIYGHTTHQELAEACRAWGSELGLEVEVRQTDSEAELVGWLHEAADAGTPVVLNAGAFQWLAMDDNANTLAFLRSGGDARAVVVFNRSDSPQTVRFAAPDGWPDSDQPADFVSDGSSAVLRRIGGEVITDLAPLTAAVFLP